MTYVIGANYKADYSQNFAGKIYHYRCPDEISLKVGDLAIVDSAHGPGIVKVQSLLSDSQQASAYVIQKIDMEAHSTRLERERRKVVLTKKLEALERELLAKEKFQLLASRSPEAASMLRELESLK